LLFESLSMSMLQVPPLCSSSGMCQAAHRYHRVLCVSRLILMFLRMQVMNAHGDNPKSAAVQRQGCMAVRNICARCPDLRPVTLSTINDSPL
jgi:hypothetical protein